MRYTLPRSATPTGVQKNDIPLWDYHVRRLSEAHAHFRQRDGEDVWGHWPGEEVIWGRVKEKLDAVGQGDWRVRLLLHPCAKVEVQAVPAPADAGPFQYLPSKDKGKGRALILDPKASDIASERSEEVNLRCYKTTNRAIYDQASARAPTLTPPLEILLHAAGSRLLLETATSNIAIESSPKGQWLTPRLDREKSPFLNGVMRQYLLDKGLIHEADLTVDDFQEARGGRRRVIGFNGLRGVWEAELIFWTERSDAGALRLQ